MLANPCPSYMPKEVWEEERLDRIVILTWMLTEGSLLREAQKPQNSRMKPVVDRWETIDDYAGRSATAKSRLEETLWAYHEGKHPELRGDYRRCPVQIRELE
ncbi:MAG TPA: hypothetical protein VJG90_01495 [Candidatus Nanoarchaeia archaeon]|nr:hypothetical protein [Candidatus Nanoarchaeia archaeon]